jgi:hypothetical protein
MTSIFHLYFSGISSLFFTGPTFHRAVLSIARPAIDFPFPAPVSCHPRSPLAIRANAKYARTEKPRGNEIRRPRPFDTARQKYYIYIVRRTGAIINFRAEI